MEYCSGGDLYTRINTGTLTNKDEINCYFKQVILIIYLYFKPILFIYYSVLNNIFLNLT